jgi:hypothetical protein
MEKLKNVFGKIWKGKNCYCRLYFRIFYYKFGNFTVQAWLLLF